MGLSSSKLTCSPGLPCSSLRVLGLSLASRPLSRRITPHVFHSVGSRTPTQLTLQPLPLLAVLNHHTRRPSPSQPRVIGALLGRRTDAGEVVVTNAFPVVHDEAKNFLAEREFREMREAYRKVSGDKEGLVGWYATSPTPDVFSALIQNFFSVETAPLPAVHLTVDTTAKGNADGLGVKGWVSSPIGITPNEFCTFLPLPLTISPATPLHAIVPSLSSTASSSSSSDAAAPSSSSSIATLERALANTRADLARVREYVDAVVKGEREGDPEVGRALMDVVGRVGGGEDWEKGVNSQLQDTLMVSYLSSLVRSQVELAARINLLQS